MTSQEIKELRKFRTRLNDLAERLDGSLIGSKPLTKRQAAIIAWGVAEDIRILLRDE